MELLNSFIARTGVELSSEWAANNPNMEGCESMDNFKVQLRNGKRRMTLYYSMGIAIGREPTTEDVLDCLASDCSSVENARDFTDWCADFGYDPDSRKAEKTYKICERQAARLRKLLGDTEYKKLLWGTERA